MKFKNQLLMIPLFDFGQFLGFFIKNIKIVWNI